MRDKNKLMILVALIAVVGVSVGFAAFSSSLLIKSKLSVAPDSSTFSVLFSSSNTTLATSPITPTKSPSTIVASNATINNSAQYPTIENLSATFTSPGDSVTYTFYARNTGKYDAYLTSIVFDTLNSGVFKECKATDGTNSDLVNSACNAISAKVVVGSESATATKQITATHLLAQNSSETVTVTLKYDSNGARADEAFEVSFGGIYLTYGTQVGMPIPNFSTVTPGSTFCVAKNSSEAGSTEIGTAYTVQVSPTESHDFYVLSTEGSNVNLLMSENINDEKYYFSRVECSNGELVSTMGDCYEDMNEGNYDLSSLTIAQNQVVSLTSNWGNITQPTRLPKYSEIAGSVCTKRVEKILGEGVYENWDNINSDHYYDNCAEWAIGDYWTSESDSDNAWAMNLTYETLDFFAFHNNPKFGIRPVITVNTSDLS